MSRYLALVLLALSTSVLAAPAEHPRQVPPTPSPPNVDTPTVEMPTVGMPAVSGPLDSRSNTGKAYSPNTPYKRDSLYPTSTEDCRSSGHSTTRSYTHEGQEYSEECLSRLAFSVPPENRQSCRTTGAKARGYDQDCLFEKAFAEDWKFDVEKVKEEELAYRSAEPSGAASDSWRALFPVTVFDCLVEISVERREAESGAYSIGPNGEVMATDCLVLLTLSAGLNINTEVCALVDVTVEPVVTVDLDIDVDLSLLGLSATGLVTATVGSIIAAIGSGCLVQIIASIIANVGLQVRIGADPLGIAPEILLVDLIALLKIVL